MAEDDLGTLLTKPRDFLNRNLLVMRGNLPAVAGIYNFQFINYSGASVPKYDQFHASFKTKFGFRRTRHINVWIVRHDTKKHTGLAGFLLPYAPNTLQRAALPIDAPLMLTAEMSGCTFGLTRYRGGMVEVCHANYQTSDGHLDTERLSRETAFCTARLADHRYRQQIRGKPVHDLRRQAGLGATVIGVNRPRLGWKIYAQLWENINVDEFMLHEVLEI